MKRLLLIIIATVVAGGISAQPKKTRRPVTPKTEAKAGTARPASGTNGLTVRAQNSFPTEAAMPEDVVWRRDIYRELDLTEEANGGMYYPVEPTGKEMNLFTYIFKLALGGVLPIYEYNINGNESFDAKAKLDFKTFMDNYHVFYETVDGKIKVDNSDIPSAEVKAYYIKESSYFDQATTTFHTQVLALCPIMMREDDFGDAAQKYPLFWVKYSDLAPFLSRQTIMTSNVNNAATMSMDDYFTLNKYKGKIYKTNNMLGRTLAQYCPTDSAMAKEQARIEAELQQFEKTVWGDQAKKDSLDSIANAKAVAEKGAKKAKAKTARQRSSSGTESKPAAKSNSKATKPKSSGTASSARVSVRRERH